MKELALDESLSEEARDSAKKALEVLVSSQLLDIEQAAALKKRAGALRDLESEALFVDQQARIEEVNLPQVYEAVERDSGSSAAKKRKKRSAAPDPAKPGGESVMLASELFSPNALVGTGTADGDAEDDGAPPGVADGQEQPVRIDFSVLDEGERQGDLRRLEQETEAELQELRRRTKEARLADKVEYALIGKEGDLSKTLPRAHLVLVDSPCTGLGTLRRNPEAKNRYGLEDIKRFQSLQLEILERFAGLVRPRGRLVYVTCSFLEGECDEVVKLFEERHPEFSASPSFWASKRLPAACLDGHKIRLGPSSTGTDAFFIASWRLEKQGGDD